MPTFRLHDHEGDDLDLLEHPAPNLEPGDVVVLAVGFAARQVYPANVDARDDVFRCSECRRTPRLDENAADEWRTYSDGIGELLLFCPEYARRESAPSEPRERARASRRRPR